MAFDDLHSIGPNSFRYVVAQYQARGSKLHHWPGQGRHLWPRALEGSVKGSVASPSLNRGNASSYGHIPTTRPPKGNHKTDIQGSS